MDLDALATPLDRSLLHVFVAGPGYGEGIAVALPGEGWLLLDGCQVVDGQLPLLDILDRWKTDAESVECAILTHPHTDHAFGVRRVLEEVVPRRVGVTTCPIDRGAIFAHFVDPRSTSLTLDKQRASVVLDAMLAVKRRFESSPDDLIPLVDGQPIPVTNSTVAVTIRAPEAAFVTNRLGMAATPPRDPNELSAVVEIVYGNTRVVLGSDLPTVDARGRDLPGGWNAVMARHLHLGQHAGLKVPHHGSPAAFHPDLMTNGVGRSWWLSPFNQGKRLPPTSPEGLPRLVGLNGRVQVTATPRPRSQQPVHADPGSVSLSALPALFAPTAPVAPGALAISPPALEPLDPVWCVAFDDQGGIRNEWRGQRAFSVVP